MAIQVINSQQCPNAPTGIQAPGLVHKLDSENVLYIYSDASNNYCKFRVVTVASNGDLTFNTEYSFGSVIYVNNITEIESGKFAVAYSNSTFYDSRIVIMTISGTTISFGSNYLIHTSANTSATYSRVEMFTSTQLIYYVQHDTNDIRMKLLGVNNTVVSITSEAQLGNTYQWHPFIMRRDANTVFIFTEHGYSMSYYGVIATITLSGTTLSKTGQQYFATNIVRVIHDVCWLDSDTIGVIFETQTAGGSKTRIALCQVDSSNNITNVHYQLAANYESCMCGWSDSALFVSEANTISRVRTSDGFSTLYESISSTIEVFTDYVYRNVASISTSRVILTAHGCLYVIERDPELVIEASLGTNDINISFSSTY